MLKKVASATKSFSVIRNSINISLEKESSIANTDKDNILKEPLQNKISIIEGDVETLSKWTVSTFVSEGIEGSYTHSSGVYEVTNVSDVPEPGSGHVEFLLTREGYPTLRKVWSIQVVKEALVLDDIQMGIENILLNSNLERVFEEGQLEFWDYEPSEAGDFLVRSGSRNTGEILGIEKVFEMILVKDEGQSGVVKTPLDGAVRILQSFMVQKDSYYTGSFFYSFTNQKKGSDRNKVLFELLNEEGVPLASTIVRQETVGDRHKVYITALADSDSMTFKISLTGEQEDLEFRATAFQVERGKISSDWGLSQDDISHYRAETAQVKEGLSTLERTLTETEESLRLDFKMGAGVNLVRNSTGFFEKEGWKSSGEVSTVKNLEQEEKVIGAAFFSEGEFKLSQDIVVKPDSTYSISFWQKKETLGSSVIRIKNGEETLYTLGHGRGLEGDTIIDSFELIEQTFNTEEGQNILTISIENSEGVRSHFSGIMLNEGSLAFEWSSHPEEIANTNIRFSLSGIYVENSVAGTHTVMSPNEFAGYSRVTDSLGEVSTKRIFSLNRETTEVHRMYIEKGLVIGRMSFVPVEEREGKVLVKDGVGIFI